MTNGVFAADQLKLFMDRIDRLEEEKQGISDDIRDVYGEAKANGFDTGIMRKARAIRKMEPQQRDDQFALLDTYLRALGIKTFESTPLGNSAAAAFNKMDALADESGGTISLQNGEGETLVEFGAEAKRKRGRPKKVRDPSDGSEKLVTVGDNDDSHASSPAA